MATKNKISKKIDILILLIINILAVIISILFEPNFIVSAMLFFGLPTAYIMTVHQLSHKNILIASVSLGIFMCYCFELLAEHNNAWKLGSGTTFGKIFGIAEIDILIWSFLWVLFILTIYSHFMPQKLKTGTVSRRSYKSLKFSLICAGILTIFYLIFPNALVLPKPYLTISLFGLIPFGFLIIKRPSLVLSAFMMVPYFVFVFLAHEITSLRLGHWLFPGDYIATMNLGGVSMSFEELFFWIILGAPVMVVYYARFFGSLKELKN